MADACNMLAPGALLAAGQHFSVFATWDLPSVVVAAPTRGIIKADLEALGMKVMALPTTGKSQYLFDVVPDEDITAGTITAAIGARGGVGAVCERSLLAETGADILDLAKELQAALERLVSVLTWFTKWGWLIAVIVVALIIFFLVWSIRK